MNLGIMRRRAMSPKGEEVDYSRQYLTFVALEAGTFTLTIPSQIPTSYISEVSFSVDGGETWVTTNNIDGEQVAITTPVIPTGGKVLWKGLGLRMSREYNANPSVFSSTGRFNVGGNLRSLLYNGDFDSVKNVPWYTFPSLFRGAKVVDASCLYLPSIGELTTGQTMNGYLQNMFNGCTQLIAGPVIRRSMDIDKAGILANFFNGCTSLRKIEMYATGTPISSSFSNWVRNVPSGGTFYKSAEQTSLPSGDNGIPNGWTVIDV